MYPLPRQSPSDISLSTLYYPQESARNTTLSYLQDIYILLYISDKSIITFTKHKVITRTTFNIDIQSVIDRVSRQSDYGPTGAGTSG